MAKKKGPGKAIDFIGRREILKKIRQNVKKQEPFIVLKGNAGVGKSFILNRILDELKKKSYNILMFRGITSAEMILKKITQVAEKKGINEANNTFTLPIEYKEKLKKFLENFLYKEKFLLVFEDFDENQNTEGEIINERLKELLFYFKDELKEKESTMLFCTRVAIPKFDALEVEPFTWQEFLDLISTTIELNRLKEKQLKSFYFDMGGYPRAVELFDKIAHQEFGTNHFDWTKLRGCVPNLAERLLHKNSESADFSYLLIETLLGYLDKQLRQKLNALCIYRGWVYKEAIEAQDEEINLSDRKKLEKLSLIHYLSGKKMYEIHRLTVQIVRSQLHESEAKERHLKAARFFESLIPQSASAGLPSKESSLTYDENALEARWHYLEAGAIEKATAMTFDMDIYFSRIGFPQFAFDLIQDMEKYIEEMSEEFQIHLHLRLGTFYSIFGKLDEAIRQHEACLKIHEMKNDTRGIALNRGQLGLLYEAKAKYDEALDNYQKSLVKLEELNEKADIARILGQIGSIQKQQGNYDESFKTYKRALPLNRELNNQAEIATNLEQMGRIHDEQGKFDIALYYYNQSLEIKERLKDKPGIAGLIHQMGNVKFFKGDLDESFSLYRRSLKIKEEIDDHKGAGYSLGQLGLIYQRKGNIDEAQLHFEQSLEKFQKAKEEKGIAASHHQLGRIYESKGEWDKAREHYEKALEIREKTGDMLGAAITYGQLGMFYYQKEEYETALQLSTQAFAIFSRYGSPNADLARNNMLRIRQKIPKEKFDAILKQFNIKTDSSPPKDANKTDQNNHKKKKKKTKESTSN